MAVIRIELFLASVFNSGCLIFMEYDIDFTFTAGIQNFLSKTYLK